MCVDMRIGKKLRLAVSLALALGGRVGLPAAIVGTNPPALPLSAERIALLPASERDAWNKYLKQSERQWLADQQSFFSELKQAGLKESLLPPHSTSDSRLPLKNPAAWYGQAEAWRIADIVVSFQTPAGGWSKNLDMTQHRRAPGEQFAGDNTPMHIDPLDNDKPRDIRWSYVGTLDNDATTIQMRYLGKVITATDAGQNAPYRKTFLHGLNYLFAAQYPNGGWPQVWPLQGGYHDSVTFNDGAMIHVLELLQDVAEGTTDFQWVPQETRTAAAASLKRGLACILQAQIFAGGRRTVWCQQHDALTLQPASARNYEMPSQCGSESADVMIFLMRLPKPDPKTVAAVHAAAAWFEKGALHNVAYQRDGNDDRQLVHVPGAGPLWARYYAIGTDRPLFGDRDKTIHDDVMEISKERRKGYSWFGDKPSRALQEYRRWKDSHPMPKAPLTSLINTNLHD
jgi:PelA/Pel-15E family pectate lyase